ncbi:hypothetical protein Ae201684_004591 [Aphanomyces euteiches]|uniref:Uncharacterized protein n=1 Tax=Aphanomyces euteiches TaxID=100861 RepID=A0A6G0XHZ4_9STRA|nr:hypothetical protein Ae201684_004591 [Aphanomyces euteiches]
MRLVRWFRHRKLCVGGRDPNFDECNTWSINESGRIWRFSSHNHALGIHHHVSKECVVSERLLSPPIWSTAQAKSYPPPYH